MKQETHKSPLPRRKGVILAGGLGTRLSEETTIKPKTNNKHLLSVYDKPMINYALGTLMLMGITEIVIISSKNYIVNFEELLNDGRQFGLKINYSVQSAANGIADALFNAKDFINGSPCAVILGDNFFFGNNLADMLTSPNTFENDAHIFVQSVKKPSEYGVANFSDEFELVNIVEKPPQPVSKWAVTGLYLYNVDIMPLMQKLTPSERGEIEITALNNLLVSENKMNYTMLGRGISWIDMGTHNSMLKASQYVATIEERQNTKIACLEELSLRMNYITLNQYKSLIHTMPEGQYKEYLVSIGHEVAAEN